MSVSLTHTNRNARQTKGRNAMNAPVTNTATPLARKALLVKLTSTRPTTSRREKAAEAIIQQQTGDASLTVSSHIFRARTNPVRKVLNESGEVYAWHCEHTLPWQDRGPRLLPLETYETYSTKMRGMISGLESSVVSLESIYDGLVQADITERQTGGATTARDYSTDYPSFEEFKDKMKFAFTFSPVPDASHFLFDINEDDKAALAAQVVEAEKSAKAQLTEQMHAPLLHLIAKLKRAIGSEGAIFRDSALENIVEQCEVAESLAMGDEALLAMIQEVRVAIRPHALAPNQLRESPVVRADTAHKLAAVASRMSFMMGN